MLCFNNEYEYVAELLSIKPYKDNIIVEFKDDDQGKFKIIYKNFKEFFDKWEIIKLT